MKTLNIIASTLLLSILLYSCGKNENAPVVSGHLFLIKENSPAGTIVGTVNAYDADDNPGLTFEIIHGNEEESFLIGSETGILSVGNPSKLDYEYSTEFVLEIAVSDNHKNEPLESANTIQVNLIDENEFAPVIKPQVFELDENSTEGYEISTVEASDQDSHQVLQYSILETGEGVHFQIDPKSGKLSVLDPVAFDYETNRKFSVDIEVTDGHENPKTAQATMTVNINNVKEIHESLVAYYPFNGNANDKSGNEINGIVSGAVLTTDRNGAEQSAYNFDGADDHITLTNDPRIHFGDGDFSISLWYELSSLEKKPQTLISAYSSSGGNREFKLAVEGESEVVSFSLYNNGAPTDSDIIRVGKSTGWQHVTITKNSSEIIYYINGERAASTPLTAKPLVTNATFIIGAVERSRYTPDIFFDGKIDEIYLHERALEDWEIANLFQLKQHGLLRRDLIGR